MLEPFGFRFMQSFKPVILYTLIGFETRGIETKLYSYYSGQKKKQKFSIFTDFSIT